MKSSDKRKIVQKQKELEIDEVIEAVRADGYTHALLMGMGGSSLAPEVFRKVFDVADGFLDLAVLDSTDPEAVRFWGEHLDPARTLFIPATKSGGTVETISFLKYFYNLTANAVGEARVGEHFVAITDPESGLADLAGELEFRHIFLNDPDIGGRYSALSMFGLVPARLIGVDLARLLGAARAAAEESGSGASDGALVLGAAMAWSVIDPVRAMGYAMHRIVSGDFTQPVRVDNKDELGELSDHVNATAQEL